MTFWTPENLRAATGGSWVVRPPEIELPKDRPADMPPPPLHAPVSGLSTDSRSLRPGQVFVALRGENHDGHLYLQQAAAAGAPILIVDRTDGVPEGGFAPACGVLRVADTGKALLRIAAAYRQSFKQTKVIAVCGSNGKTTTTRLIDHVLRQQFRGSASPKSFNNSVGVPLTIVAAQPTDQYLVCEVGTNAPGEIAALAEVVNPDIAVIVSIGREHLEKLHDLAGVAKEEAAILAGLRARGCAIVTADSPELQAHLGKIAQLITFGKNPSANLRVADIRQSASGLSFSVNGRLPVRLPLLGEHNAVNALAALAVARRMGMDEHKAALALATAPGAEMRLQLRPVAGVDVLNDAYNANPDSTAAALRTLTSLAADRAQAVGGGNTGRVVAVLADMLELGAATDDGHRSIASAVVEAGAAPFARPIDLVILVGSSVRVTRDELLARGFPRERIVHVQDLEHGRAEGIADEFAPGDLVLLKGSRRMRLERIAGALASKDAGSADGGHARRLASAGAGR
jgi:UDP-N-acetylmuramoyl-tripeptide--D-alanyl-D-alanine ligase